MSESNKKRVKFDIEFNDKTNESDKDDNSDAVNDLINIRNTMHNKRNILLTRANKILDKIYLIEKNIMELCNHEWVKDYDASDPSGRCPRICNKCNLSRL